MTGSVARAYVRAPNHLGDVVMAIPAIRHMTDADSAPQVDVWCPRVWASVLEMAELSASIIPFRRTRALWRTAAAVRRRRYDQAVLLTPSFSTAAVVWLAGVPERVGTPTDGRSVLLTRRTRASEAPGEHRTSFYRRIVDPERTGADPVPPPRIRAPKVARDQALSLIGGRLKRPVVGIVPGSKAPARRWPEGRFTALAGMLARDGATVLAFGGPEEQVLAARVAAGAGDRGRDLGGRTTLPVLASAFELCDLVVTNDTGPMHLAAAVGTAVVAVFGASDPARTGPLGVPSHVMQSDRLPCAPCYRNRCVRRGPGTFLPEAHEECLHLIGVDAVVRKVRELLPTAEVSGDVEVG